SQRTSDDCSALIDRTPSFTSFNEGGNSCGTKGACTFVYGIKGALPLLHAGPGCSYCAYWGTMLHSGGAYPFLNTGFCSNDVIFGGEAKLKKGIVQAKEIHNPEVIVIIPGCQASTIGDDIDGVIAGISEETLSAYLLNAWTGGYVDDLYSGFVKVGLSFLKRFCNPLPTRSKLVNIIGFPAHINIYWKGDMKEIRSLLSLLGLEINCFFPGDVSLQQIREIPAAALNLVVDEQLGLEMAEYLKEEFGTPYIKPRFGSLIGTDNTMEFLSAIIEQLDLPSDLHTQLSRAKHAALEMAGQHYHIWNEFLQYAFPTFALTAHASMALGICRMLVTELGMEPKLVHFSPSEPHAKTQLNQILEADGRGFTPMVLENGDNQDIIECFLETDDWPKIFFGKGTAHLKYEAFVNEAAVYMAVSYPAMDRFIIYDRPIMGFNGVPAMVDDIVNRMGHMF
ncbi:MAG: nitrogenase component 1, partial [Desulfuromonadaceae bacterium]